MPGPRTIPLEALAELAGDLDHASPVTIARRHGLTGRVGSLSSALHDMRRAGGWYCRLLLVPCTEYGLPVAGPPPSTSHPGCRTAKQQRRERERNARDPGRRSAWRREHPERRRAVEREAEARRRAGMSTLELAQVRAQAVERNRGYQDQTLQEARARGAPWSADEDAYLLEHWRDRLVDLGLALGRTWRGVECRRRVLRWHGLAPR